MEDTVVKLIGIICVAIFAFAFMEWHARMVFVAVGYPRRNGHGKSFNRARKHYKANWTFWQRLLWIPVFKEQYENKYREMAYLSYAHVLVTLLTTIIILVDEFILTEINFWRYAFIAVSVFAIVRFIYDNGVGKGNV